MATGARQKYRDLALLACKRILDFSGRSSRIELGAFLIYAIALDAILNLIIKLTLDGDIEAWSRLATDTVLFIPAYALIARRLHDLGRSGRWALVPIFVLLRAPVLKAIALTGHPDARDWIESAFEPLNWLLVPAFLIIVIAAVFVPGRGAANRFGPSPVAVAAPDSETADADISTPAV
jgi:uncharacterized membrane protein YhaH (DUF805 family)